MYSGTAITHSNGKQLRDYQKKERTSAQLAGLWAELADHELDNKWEANYKTYQDMLSDPTIAFARMLCVAPLTTVGWSYEEKDDAPPGAKECIQDSLEPWRINIVKSAMEGYIDYGWSGYEMVYSVEKNKAYLQKVKNLLQANTLILVATKTGEYLGMRQFDWRGQDVDLGIYDSLHIAIDVEGTNWYGRPLLENCRKIWGQWNQVNDSANKYDTKVAGASWVVYYPVGDSPYNGMESVDNYIIATDFLNKLQANGRLAVPMTIAKWQTDMNVTDENAGWKIELISDKGATQVGFIERQKYLDALKVRAFGLPERAVLEGQFGTKAEAQAHADFAITVFEMRHQIIVQQINKQVTNFLLATNFGEEYEDTVIVKANPLVDEKRMLLEKIYLQIIGSPDGLMQEMAMLDMETFRKQLDLPENQLLAQNGMPAAQGMLSKYFAEMYGLPQPQPTSAAGIQSVRGEVVIPPEYWEKQKRGIALALSGFDPSKHPRVPAGQGEHGGEFTSKGAASATDTANKPSNRKTSAYSPEDAKTLEKLRIKWAVLNNEYLQYKNDVNHPRVKDLIEQQKAIIRQLYLLKADPGTMLEGFKKPGGPRDMLVIGSGPAGMQAAIMAGTSHLDVLVVEGADKPGGQARTSSRIENFPGYPAGVTGEKLATDMYEQVQRVGAEIKLGTRVTSLAYDKETGMKHVTLSNGEVVTARTVVIAGGVKYKTADWPGANSPNVIYGDAHELANLAENKNSVVIGGSNGGGQAALGSAETAKHVYMITRSPLEKGMSSYVKDTVEVHPKVTVIQGTVDKFENGIVHINDQKIPAPGIGVFIGGEPDTQWLPESIVVNKETGRIKTNSRFATNMPGVYAVGDVREGSMARLVAAAGEGALVETYLAEDFRLMKNVEREQRGLPIPESENF